MPSNVLTFDAASGGTYYGVFTAADGTVWSVGGPALIAYVAADWASYAVAVAEDAGASGRYALAVPASLPAGLYKVEAWKQAGASPSKAADRPAFGGEIAWDGTGIVAPGANLYAGWTFDEAMVGLAAGLRGLTDVTDLGDGLRTLAFRNKVDDADAFTVTFDTATYARTAVT